MKRYETYKDSGIQWWEEIPTHWDLKKAKHMFSLVTENVSDSSLPKIALENIESWTGKYIETDSDFMGEGVEFKKDDILFGKLRPYLAKVYKAEFAGQAVGDIYVFRGNEEQNPEYLKYLLLSYPFISVVDGSTYGAKMPRANWDFISHLVLPCPPKTEQVTIAAYLDHKVSQIDATIAEKEQMLEDLKNYRSAIISEAVTKGLDKNVEMKDSGIEWIGIIPKHWTVSNIGRLFNIKAGGDAKPEFYSSTKDDVHKFPVYTNAREADHVYAFSSYAPFSGNSITVTGRGDIGHAIFRSNEYDAIIRLLVLQPKNEDIIDARYFAYFIDEKIHFFTDSAAVGQLSAIQISPYKICFPPIKEQRAISNYLDERIAQIDVLTKKIDSQISDLKSYKSALITEAVTGKIDLREWKPKEEKV